MQVCEKYDLLMIADEVITGFGRLGRMFGSEVVGYRPHAISIAKALSSAYLPIAGVLVPPRMYEALVGESRKIGAFGHGFTYSGHPVAAAVALKTLEIFARDRIVDRVVALMPQFRDGLARAARVAAHLDGRGSERTKMRRGQITLRNSLEASTNHSKSEILGRGRSLTDRKYHTARRTGFVIALIAITPSVPHSIIVSVRYGRLRAWSNWKTS
jgi:adenosylmethionine-8-amino-7-oxononanoate aminotransferase